MPDVDDVRLMPELQRLAYMLGKVGPRRLARARELSRRAAKIPGNPNRLRRYPR